jgi:putative sporulation protein YyaC
MIEIPNNREVYFLCIGTDRSTGDSFGPLVGTYLTNAGIPNVLGTIDDPVHAMNLEERAASIPAGAFIIAVDATLGNASMVGQVYYKNKPVTPGAGVGKQLGSYGDASITGCVNVGGFMEYFVLQNTRLSLVMRLANEAAATCIELVNKNKLMEVV